MGWYKIFECWAIWKKAITYCFEDTKLTTTVTIYATITKNLPTTTRHSLCVRKHKVSRISKLQWQVKEEKKRNNKNNNKEKQGLWHLNSKDIKAHRQKTVVPKKRHFCLSSHKTETKRGKKLQLPHQNYGKEITQTWT